ncbi:MAG TPA: Gfo/Idh/MocA family oxidoreductase [Verrucomicrobiae bacterium]|jgi:predicted dehydrogenase
MNNRNDLQDSNRREFLKNASFATAMAIMGGVELRASETPGAAPAAPDPALTKIPATPPINIAVIGLGEWGREILVQLGKINTDPKREKQNNFPVVAICDNYKNAFRRAAQHAPDAKQYEDYTQLLADPKVQGVIIATPTGTHKAIALAAIAAGKHVYCEAPLANTVEDAREIAKAARPLVKTLFQAGLQQRSHPQIEFLLPFIRSGALGVNIMVRAQWHKNTSWHTAAASAERDAAINWRLVQATSTGLLGEEGIHQIDSVCNFLKGRPRAVTGWSSTIRSYDDHRSVPDTVQAVFEYPHGVNFFHDLTICNSYENAYEVYLGDESAMMMRDFKAWLFKESNAALGGWEVYARHDQFYGATGIALVAGASKQTTLAGSAESFNPYDQIPLYYALDCFTDRAGRLTAEVASQTEIYGETLDLNTLAEYLKTVPALNAKPIATWQDGLDATIIAIKANEAALHKQKIVLEKEFFEI